MNQRIKNKFKRFLYLFYGEKFFKRFKYNWVNYPSKTEIMQKIINEKDFKSYLEIGCFDNELFDYVKCNKKVGVDPYTGGTIRKTSDKFFESNNENFDCIFIDGLHTYNQVKKDIYNSLKFLNPNGIILLHDCLPNNYFEQATPRCQYIWNGDVWKAIVECRTNKDLDTYTCYADFGIGAILNRSNQKILNVKYNDFAKIKFKDYFTNYKEYMNIVEFEDLLKVI